MPLLFLQYTKWTEVKTIYERKIGNQRAAYTLTVLMLHPKAGPCVQANDKPWVALGESRLDTQSTLMPANNQPKKPASLINFSHVGVPHEAT